MTNNTTSNSNISKLPIEKDLKSESLQGNEPPRWGRFATHLPDGSNITWRRTGDTEWTESKVLDSRIYKENAKAVNPGEVYHVTHTTKGTIDFRINWNGENCGNQEFEVKIEN
jgi:hypothetical protein